MAERPASNKIILSLLAQCYQHFPQGSNEMTIAKHRTRQNTGSFFAIAMSFALSC
jgi:hypothetical protein